MMKFIQANLQSVDKAICRALVHTPVAADNEHRYWLDAAADLTNLGIRLGHLVASRP